MEYVISITKPTRCINVSNLFYWTNTVHVSDRLSVHHQELETYVLQQAYIKQILPTAC